MNNLLDIPNKYYIIFNTLINVEPPNVYTEVYYITYLCD